MKKETETIRHPAFGNIVATRCQCGPKGATLFGSSAEHHQYVQLSINTATLQRDLNTDWIHADKSIISISMTEAQWAHFVSSFGDGGGTPVTINWTREDGRIAEPPQPVPVIQKFTAELKEKVNQLVNDTKVLNAMIAQASVPGKPVKKSDLDVIKTAASHIETELRSNLPFVQECFIEEMESIEMKARIDFDAYMQNSLQRRGLEALKEDLVLKKLVFQEQSEDTTKRLEA